MTAATIPWVMMEMAGEVVVEVKALKTVLATLGGEPKKGFGDNRPHLPTNQIGLIMSIGCSNNPLGNAGNDGRGGGDR